MKDNKTSKILPYIVAGLLFVVLAYTFMPDLLKGKRVMQSDTSSWVGMAHEAQQYNAAHDTATLWTGSMFSGMPTYTITGPKAKSFITPVYDLLFLGTKPAVYLIIAMIGAFLLFLALGMNPWLSIVGAIAFTFCSYNFQIIQVGHQTKMAAIAFMPWVMASLIYAYRRHALLGAALFGIALSFQIKANHVQITYYLAWIVLFFAISRAIIAWKEKQLKKFFITSALLLVAGLLGIAANANDLMPLREYTPYSMRGGSDLSDGSEKSSEKGLDLEYATQWSYGPEEMPNLLIPNFNGGVSSGPLGKDSQTYKYLKDNGYQANNVINAMPLYWGPQPFTAGPMYMGAVLIFLFVLGLFIIKGPRKWWIVAVCLLTILLSWGNHFMGLTRLFFEYVPLYNKFRTVSMILVILQLCIPMLGIYALSRFLDSDVPKAKLCRSLYWSCGMTAGFCLLFAAFPFLAGAFYSPADASLPQELIPALIADRMSLLRADALRSALFIAAAAVVLLLAVKGKMKVIVATAFLGILVLVDFWGVDKRYLNSSHFVRESQFQQQFKPRQVDEMILLDTDPHYRVLDMSINTFNDSHVSYHHKTIGGYSAAKLQRYQDIIDRHLTPEISIVQKGLQDCESYEQAEAIVADCSVMAMLNAKYVVFHPDNPPIQNPGAMGNAWWVNRIVCAEGAKEEMEALDKIDIREAAVISWPEENGPMEKDYMLEVQAAAENGDVSAPIELLSYAPNKLKYHAASNSGGLAIFSEVFYPKGWIAKVDGVETPILRANYILRAILIPSGAHNIEFEFYPKTYYRARSISYVISALLLLLLAAGIFDAYRKGKKSSLCKTI